MSQPHANDVDRQQPPSRSRRRFLKFVRNGFFVGGGLFAWTAFAEPFWLEVKHHILPIPNLPESWFNRRLIHVSDWHVGRTNQEYLKRSMEVINLLEPDVLLITGDLVDIRSGPADLDSVLNRLKPARIATLGSLGNHDYGLNYKDLQCAANVVDVAEQHGIRILRNEKVVIEGLDFFGLEDFWSPRFQENLSFLQNEAAATRPAICLCHNPDVCDIPKWGDFQGCILSGHTHGGQCKPPFLPAPLLPVVNRRYTQGFIGLDGKRRLYITRGIGYSYQVRFNCQPEITVFNLVKSTA